MKTSTIIINSLLLATGLAAPVSLTKRDLATIQGALKQVEDGLGKVKTAAQGLDGNDINSGTPILSASDALSKTIKQATADIQGSQELSLQDALSLQQSSSALITAAQDTVTALAGKKAALDQLGVTQVAVTTLKQQKTDSTAFGKVLVSKVPAIGQGIAQQSVDQIGQALDKGIAALSAAPAGGAAAPAKPAEPAPAEPAAPKPAEPAAPKPAEPAEPATPKPAEPAAPKPAEPATPKPAEPATPKPAEPATPKPAEPAAPKPADPATPKPAEPATPKPEEPAACKPAAPKPAAPKPATPKPAEPAAKPAPAAGNNNNNNPLGTILGLVGQGNNANGNPLAALLGAAGGANGNKAGANAAPNPLAALTGNGNGNAA
ncbi:hypothetical protein RB600_009484 [Gaeumannomyces tritici]